MKVLFLGAGGIIGQHCRLVVPSGVEAIFARRTADPISTSVRLEHPFSDIEAINPEVIVNLAGESSVDEVERKPDRYRYINEWMPAEIAHFCRRSGARLIHISSQAVKEPVNEYGRQKLAAERALSNMAHVTVMRLTFILGIRPLPYVGRQNPLEAMIAGQSPQVCDRWFSPLAAMDAAELIWEEITHPSGVRLIECGIPQRTSRYDIAKLVNPDVQPCSHDDFPGIAPRPIDTTYGHGARWKRSLEHLDEVVAIKDPLLSRAAEISMFLNRGGLRWWDCEQKLREGFGPLHNAVSDDFRKANPKTDEELLDWYRTTEAYIFELSAYHEDPGFNYAGMCRGIVDALKTHGAKSVLCLGDGIGDLTLAAHRAGLQAFYHDLYGSRTAEYAQFRHWRANGNGLPALMTPNFSPTSGTWHLLQFDAIVSLDFLEHVNCVDEWALAIHGALKPGGLFVAQNAFACGSGPDGAMPMHLACNDRFEKDWDPLLTEVGFEQIASQWYQKDK